MSTHLNCYIFLFVLLFHTSHHNRTQNPWTKSASVTNSSLCLIFIDYICFFWGCVNIFKQTEILRGWDFETLLDHVGAILISESLYWWDHSWREGPAWRLLEDLPLCCLKQHSFIYYFLCNVILFLMLCEWMQEDERVCVHTWVDESVEMGKAVGLYLTTIYQDIF